MEMMDRVLEILSMYRLPSIYKYVFSKFIPMLMKDSKHFYYDGFLSLLQTVLRKLVHCFEAPSLRYDNLYSSDIREASINTVQTSLLETIFKDRHQLVGQGGHLAKLIEGCFKLNKAIDTTSPSLTFQFIYSTCIEKANLDCLDEVISFIHKMLPVMFIKTNKIENILVLFEMILKIGYDCVRKMSLSAFCEFNLSFLECWSVLEIYVNPSADKVSAEKMKNLKKKYIAFNLDYFSSTLFTSDCFKELNDIPNIETVLQNLKDLYFIRSRILILTDDFSRLEEDKHNFIYGRLFPVEGYFLKQHKVCIEKISNSFTLRHLNDTIGLVACRKAPVRLFLNIEIPASDQFKNGEPIKKSPKKIIGDLIAHEIEKIKGHFYTRFKYCKEFPDLLTGNKMSEQEFEEDVTRIFWINPKTAFALASRLVNEVKRPSPNILPKILGPLIEKIDEVLITEKEFVQPFIDYIYSKFSNMERLKPLFYWEMPHIPLVLKYIGEEYNRWPILGMYFAKMMLRISSEQLTFYLAQIFQALNYEISDIVEDFLLKYSRNSPLFSHQLIWKARCEEKEDDPKEFSKNVKKRKLAAGLPMKIMKEMGIEEKKFWDEEDSFFEQITKISSALEPKSEKAVKKEKINSLLQKIKMPSLVYMPTNPNRRVVEIVQGSGKPMQSAARCPVWVSFRCKPFEGPDKYFEKRKQMTIQKPNSIDFFDDIDEGITPLMHTMMKDRQIDVKWKSSGLFSTNKKAVQGEMTLELENTSKGPSRFSNLAEEVLPRLRRGTNLMTYVPVKLNESGMSPVVSTQRARGPNNFSLEIKKANQRLKTDDEKDEEIACIFKTHDDIRKDNLSLQVIKMFQEAFRLERLDVFVFPYLTISTRTGNEKILGGIIQVVPNTFSRDQIGKENKYSLYEFFKEKYGGEMSPLFQKARENFIKSMAAYSVVSYILQLKDRHNGNIIIDNLGHLIHIDFGFIFDISPGKNMKFENAEFKLTQYSRLK